MLAIVVTGHFSWQLFLVVSLLTSLFYVSGMILNDVFDSKIDAIERPSRPIPSGQVTRKQAGIVAATLLLSAVNGLEFLYKTTTILHFAAPVLLASVILLYDIWHKGNYFSPFVMASCRFMVYVAAVLTVADQVPIFLWGIAGVAGCYIVGLTYLAMQENLQRIQNYWPALFLIAPYAYAWNNEANFVCLGLALIWSLYNFMLLYQRKIKEAVGGFICGVCLVDAMLLSTISPEYLLYFYLYFVITVCAQKFIPGT